MQGRTGPGAAFSCSVFRQSCTSWSSNHSAWPCTEGLFQQWQSHPQANGVAPQLYNPSGFFTAPQQLRSAPAHAQDSEDDFGDFEDAAETSVALPQQDANDHEADFGDFAAAAPALVVQKPLAAEAPRLPDRYMHLRWPSKRQCAHLRMPE